MSEIFNIAMSVGSASLIIAGLSTWLGKVWASRILEQDRHKYELKLAKLTSELAANKEKNQLIFSLYFEGQFKIYNDLWVALVGLQYGVEALWKEASTKNLDVFVLALKKAKRQIQQSALLIEPQHYVEIMDSLKAFEEYKVGKEKLIDVRQTADLIPQQIKQIIEDNREKKDLINIFTSAMLEKMREQVRGAGSLLSNG